MIRLLSDNDVQFQARLIWTVFTDQQWEELGIGGLSTLRDLGLPAESSDRDVWLYCQAHAVLLVTGNRNRKGTDSLEQVIAELGEAQHLPVLTIGAPKRVYDSAYREDCAYRIADVALALDRVRGSGRLFIP